MTEPPAAILHQLPLVVILINTMNSDNFNPQVSIIVTLEEEYGADSIFTLLDSFYPQEGEVSFEFIIVCHQDSERIATFQKRFPWVELIKVNRYLFGSALRNIAVKHAKGRIIAFLEDHVLVQKNYLMNLLATISKGYDIVGGHVDNANPESFVGWIQYFSEYNKYIPTSREGEVEDLPGCNFAYRSDLIEKLGPFYEGRYKLENLFHELAKKSGHKLYLSRDLQVAHLNGEKIIAFWKKRFEYGRLFASQRGFSLKMRILYMVLSPFIAMIEYIRIFKQTKDNRAYLIKFIQCTPLLFPTLLIWMTGECAGYLFGIRTSSHHLRRG